MSSLPHHPSPPSPSAPLPAPTTTTAHSKGGPSKGSSSSSSSSSFGVSLVFQRFRSCELLVNDAEWVRVGCTSRSETAAAAAAAATTTATSADCSNDIKSDPPPESRQQQQQQQQHHCGLLVYVSFARDAAPDCVGKAARAIVSIPLLTEGVWGDGVSKTFGALSLRQNQQQEHNVGRSIVLVPQANLICKVKQQGKSVQYHGQASSIKGRDLYEQLVQHVQRLVDEHNESSRNSIRERGSEEGAGESDGVVPSAAARSSEDNAPRPGGGGGVEVVAGTFGTRQGIAIESDMGPFCHVVNI
jgi:D-Tyr-tRNA(Tyr) deacylase